MPVLLSVTVCAALVTFKGVRNASGPSGLTVAIGAVPVPLTVIVAGLPGSEVARLTVADKAPATVGANLTVKLQVLPASKVVAVVQLPPNKKLVGLAPVKVTPLTVRVVVPRLVTVTVCVVLVVPNSWLPNIRLLAEREIAVAVPVRGTL